jgi:hypothetical protein
MWQWSSRLAKAKKRAAVAAPPPDPKPYEVPNAGESIPYVYANPDFATGPEYPNYKMATTAQKSWVDKGAVPTGWRPSPRKPPEEWAGYERWGDYGRSIEEEHQINGREGLPLQGYSRYQSALNPYWYRIPDTRIQRAPHEYDFERPFDQNTLGERQLNGMHYSEATIGLTTSPSQSLKGMSPAKRRISTFRLEPTEWGENTVSQAARQGPPSAVYTSPNYTFNTSAGTFRLS